MDNFKGKISDFGGACVFQSEANSLLASLSLAQRANATTLTLYI